MWILIHDFNHQLKKVVGCKVLQFIQTMKIKKMLGHKTLRCTNIATSTQERWTRANFVSGHNLLEQTLLNTYATCVHFDGPQNNHFICLVLWEKKAQTYNHRLESKQIWNYVFYKPRQIAICQAVVKLQGRNSSSSSINTSCRDLINLHLSAWILDRLAWLQHLILKQSFLKY